MSSGFVHSLPVPRLYKTAAKTVRQVTEEGASLKQLIYEKKHPNLKGVYALATTTLHNAGILNQIIRHTQLLFKEPRFDPWLARVLITELIWGKGVLSNDSKPIQTLLTYEQDIRSFLQTSPPESTPDAPKKEKKPRYVRVNTLVKSVEDAVEGFKGDGYELLPRPKSYEEFLDSVRNLGSWAYPAFIQDFHIEELFVFPAGTQFYDHPGYQCGAIVLQDKASCLPAYLLDPKPCSVVLDMCAAPGMKTTHLAAILQNRGKVFSVERNERRYQVLCDMVNNANAECVQTLNQDALTLTPETCADVEYILVDPSCSGSGMDRPDFEDTQGRCAPGRLKRLQSFQVLLLRHALLSFPSAKRVTYSTCSMYPEENEMVVDEVLSDIGGAYTLVPIKQLLKSQWLNFSSKDYQCGDSCLYAIPDIDYSNGFFVAVFERNPEVPLPDLHKKKPAKEPPKTTAEDIEFTENREKNCKKKKKTKRDSEADDVDNFNEHSKTNTTFNNETAEKPENLGRNAELSNGAEINEIREKKCKKKKKSKRDSEAEDDDNFNEDLRTENEIIAETQEGEDMPGKKCKKKHKRNGKVGEEMTYINVGNVDEGIVDATQENKKKEKKKKRRNEEILESVDVMSGGQEAIAEEINNEDASKSKKNKKRKEEREESCEVHVESEKNLMEAEMGKNKKRKRKSEEPKGEIDVHTKNSEVDEHLVEDIKKKKKKRKKCKDNSDE